MTVTEVIKELGLNNSDFQTSDDKIYVYQIPDSDSFSRLFNLLDSDEKFEEDLDSQDINLFTNTVVFIDGDGEVECTLFADFTKDTYTLTLVVM